MTKRYYRTDGNLPEIYPGSLAGLTECIRDAQAASEEDGGCHRVWMHDPPAPKTLVREFVNGELIKTEGSNEE